MKARLTEDDRARLAQWWTTPAGEDGEPLWEDLLEVVEEILTVRINSRTSHAKTECIWGHDLTKPENVKVVERPGGGKMRRCVQCQRRRDREYQQKKRSRAMIESLWGEVMEESSGQE